MSLVPCEPAELDLATATLDELAATAARQYGEAETALFGALGHVVNLGATLTEARRRVDHGDWRAWCDAIGISQHTANAAMRLAHYRNHLPTEIRVDGRGRTLSPSVGHALQYLRGLPDVRPRGTPAKFNDDDVSEAKRLHAAGVPVKEIADLLGAFPASVYKWLDPEAYRARQRRNRVARTQREREARAAKRALERQRERKERDRLAKATGGELEVAYTHVRRALAAVSKAGTVELAERALLKAEEELIAAMRRTDG